jgi:hypothetical protein
MVVEERRTRYWRICEPNQSQRLRNEGQLRPQNPSPARQPQGTLSTATLFFLFPLRGETLLTVLLHFELRRSLITVPSTAL